MGYVIMALLVAAAFGVYYAGVRADERRAARKRRVEEVNIRRAMARTERQLSKLERIARLGAVTALVAGEKCRGCSAVRPAEEMEDVGENATTGKPVRLCRDCRGVMNMEE